MYDSYMYRGVPYSMCLHILTGTRALLLIATYVHTVCTGRVWIQPTGRLANPATVHARSA